MPDHRARQQFMDLHRSLEHADRIRATATTAKDAQTMMHRQLQPSATTATNSTASTSSRGVQMSMETKRMMGRSFRTGSAASQDRDLCQRRTRSTTAVGDDDDDLLAELQMQQRTSCFVATDAHESLAAGATSFDSRATDCAVHDDNDGLDNAHSCYLVDSPEIAAFLGMTTAAIAPAAAYTATAPPPFLKAASFSGQQQYQQRGMTVPCSPPVPIPRQQLRRRRNTVTGSLRSTYTTSAACEHVYSRTQSEARLWDDDWHFKLSRESFESSKATRATRSSALPATRRRAKSCTSSLCTGASSSTAATAAAGPAVWKAQSTSSLTSTADTVRDEDSPASDCCCDDDEDDDETHHVFDMDDL